jgi:peptidoglycan/xylan/chitin deacetylase (PgdA/CDA1 family)
VKGRGQAVTIAVVIIVAGVLLQHPVRSMMGKPPLRPTAASPVIALTFDDGPSPQYTPKILQLLTRYHAHATFFVLGTEVTHFPNLARDIIKQGSVIANHGYDHVNFVHLGVVGTARDAEKLTALLNKEHIAQVPFYRPPYGLSNRKLVAYMSKRGYTVTLWSIDTRDWAMPGASFITRRVLNEAAPGAIVLMHDSGGNRTQTIEALAAILPVLEAEGYQLVTLPQYVKDMGLKAPPQLPLPPPALKP